MSKLCEVNRADDGTRYAWAFWCPGCKERHQFTPNWAFNGDLNRPTVSPSILVTYDGADKQTRCHSFVKDGRIQFLSDCTHALAGQTLDLPELP